MDHQAFAQLLGNYGEFVGAIAVVVSLVYLALQVKRNSQQLENHVATLRRAESSVQHEQWSGWRKMQVNDPELLAIWNRGVIDVDSLDEIEYQRFNMLATELMYILSNVWERERAGVAPEGAWEIAKRSVDAFLSLPGASKWWDSSDRFFYDHFIVEVTRQRNS